MRRVSGGATKDRMTANARINTFHEEARRRAHGRLIKRRRHALNLSPEQFLDLLAAQGQPMTPSFLRYLERGRAALSRMPPELRDAIRTVLGYTPQEWKAVTGFSSPVSTASTPLTPEDLPPALVEASLAYGALYPPLQRLDVLQQLAAVQVWACGPQTSEEWCDFYLANRRWFWEAP